MKLKTTKKQIRNHFGTVLSIGYCSAQSLLHFKSPFAYSAGVYGWSCDYYQIGNVCISTGYSPVGTSVDYSLISEYEKQAKKIIHDYKTDYSERVQKVDNLLNELISKLCTK